MALGAAFLRDFPVPAGFFLVGEPPPLLAGSGREKVNSKVWPIAHLCGPEREGAAGSGVVRARLGVLVRGGVVPRGRAGRLKVTVEASRYPVTSLWFGLGAGVYAGPATWVDVESDSFRPSYVQIAPVSSQPVVSGSVIVMAPLPSGLTVMVQFSDFRNCQQLCKPWSGSSQPYRQAR